MVYFYVGIAGFFGSNLRCLIGSFTTFSSLSVRNKRFGRITGKVSTDFIGSLTTSSH
jgi:hypothetical protein